MTNIHLIRHGKRERVPGDPGLTPRGMREAHALTSEFGHGVAAIYTSPLRRAAETASILSEALSVPVTIDPRLRERMNWGDVPGQAFEEFTSEWERCCVDRSFVPVGGCSAEQSGMRIAAFLTFAAEAHPSGDILAVCHGGVIADYLLGAFSPSALAAIRPGFLDEPYSASVFPELSITTIKVREQRFSVATIGKVCVDVE